MCKKLRIGEGEDESGGELESGGKRLDGSHVRKGKAGNQVAK